MQHRTQCEMTEAYFSGHVDGWMNEGGTLRGKFESLLNLNDHGFF